MCRHLETSDVGACQMMREQKPRIGWRGDAPDRANFLQRAVEFPHIRSQGSNDHLVRLIRKLRKSTPISFRALIPAPCQQRHQQRMRRRIFRPSREAPWSPWNQASQDSEVSCAIASERLGPRLGDTRADQRAGDALARGPGKRAHFAAPNQSLIVSLQNVVPFLHKGLGKAGLWIGQQQDQRCRRIGEGPGCGRCRCYKATRAIGCRHVVGQVTEGGMKKCHHFLRRSRPKRAHGWLTAEPTQDVGSILVAVAENEIFRQRPLSGERPLLPNLFQLPCPRRSFT